MPYYKARRKQIIPTVGEIPVNTIVEADKETISRFGDDFEKCGEPNAKQKLEVVKIKPEQAPMGDKAVANSETKGKSLRRRAKEE